MSATRFSACLLMLVLMAQSATAAVVTWDVAGDTAAPADVLANGDLVQALNATNTTIGQVVVNGVPFENTISLLPSNVGPQFLGGASTGNQAYNELLDSLDFGGGVSTSINVGGGSLVPGQAYDVQVFFTDLRGCCSGRTMTYGDGMGNTVDVNATGAGLGQYATGSFTADAATQTISLAANGFGNSHITAVQVREQASPYVQLIDDDFDNNDLATGGVNGGFGLVTNGVGGTPAASESGLLASVSSVGGDNNSGIVSLSPFNAKQSDGFRMIFEVDSLSIDPANNGLFLGLQNDGSTFFRSGAVGHNFGLVFSGEESRTMSAGGFALVTNDIGAGGSQGNGVIFDHDDLQLSSLQDGFTAVVTATPDGWAYEILGVNDTGGSPMIFTGGGTWVGSGLAATFYSDFFDRAEHLAAYGQRGGGGPDLIAVYDRIAVTGTVVPEPMTGGLIALASLALVRRRRRA